MRSRAPRRVRTLASAPFAQTLLAHNTPQGALCVVAIGLALLLRCAVADAVVVELVVVFVVVVGGGGCVVVVFAGVGAGGGMVVAVVVGEKWCGLECNAFLVL